MSEIKKINGYTIKDETARNELNRINATLSNEISNIDGRLTTTEEGFSNIQEGLNNEITRSSNEEDNIRRELSSVESSLNARMDTFTSLEDGSTTGDAELIDARIGNNGKTYSSAGSSIRFNDEISHNILNKNDMFLFDSYPSFNGFIGYSGKWVNVNSNYNVKFIPVNEGDKYVIKTDGNSYMAFITDLTIPTITENGNINFVSGTGRISIDSSIKYEVFGNVPSTAHFIVIVTLNNTTINYVTLRINNHDFINTNKLTVENISNLAVNSYKQNVNEVWVNGSISAVVGNPCIESLNFIRRKNYITIKHPFDVYVISDGTFKYSLIILDNSLNVVSQSAYTTGTTLIPKNTYYRIILANALDDTSSMYDLTNEYINSHIQFVSSIYYNLLGNGKEINWIALGDSITQGTYSYMNDTTPASGVDPSKGWTNLVAISNNYKLYNAGVGGQGYLYPDSFNHITGYDYIDTINFSNYNLVTIAYGINDWKGNQVVGSYTDSSSNPTSVCGAMKHIIEHIMTSNPKCKIVVILPFNAWGYTFSYGDKSSNYGLGYEFSNSGTLESFTQKLIEVCNYYGIEYIDETHYSCINRENLPSLLLDGIHPSLDCHELISQELAKKINAK